MLDEYLTLQQARAAYCAGYDHVTNLSQSQQQLTNHNADLHVFYICITEELPLL